jgi:hypothetical protein
MRKTSRPSHHEAVTTRRRQPRRSMTMMRKTSRPSHHEAVTTRRRQLRRRTTMMRKTSRPVHQEALTMASPSACHTPFRERRNKASILVPRMFKSHIQQQYDK